MQDTISRTPGVHDFREAQIYLSAKGTKLQFKPAQLASNLLDALKNFDEYAQRTLNMEYARFDGFYINVGKEICAPGVSPYLPNGSYETEP